MMRRSPARSVTATAAITLMAAVSACGSSSSSPGSASSSSNSTTAGSSTSVAASATSAGTAKSGGSSSLRAVKTITYVNPLPSYPAFNVAGKCFKTEAAKLGYAPTEVGITGSGADNQGSINQISQAIAGGQDAVVVFPTVNSLFTPVIKQARSAGMYVVAMNAGEPSTGQQTEVGTDNAAMGKLMADGLGKTDPNAHVGFVSVSASTQSQADVIKGFQAEAAKAYPNMKVADSQFDNGDFTKGADIFKNMLAAHPEITALFPVPGTEISGAITAVREAGKTGKVNVLGLDLTDITRADIENGTLLAVGDQGWCEMGTKSVDAVKSLAEGKTLPALIPTNSKYYDKSNLPAK